MNKNYNVIFEKFPSNVLLHNYLDNLKSDFIFRYSFYYQNVIARSFFNMDLQDFGQKLYEVMTLKKKSTLNSI